MKRFYEVYQDDEKLATLRRQLSWSHNRAMMTLKSAEEKEFYLKLCDRENYSEYETKLIPKEVLRAKLNEFYAMLEGGDE